MHAVNDGSSSCVEVMKWALGRMGASNDAELNCFVSAVDESAAMKAAEEADERRARGSPLSRLDGLPITVKDNFCVAGMETTAGSKMLKGGCKWQRHPPHRVSIGWFYIELQMKESIVLLVLLDLLVFLVLSCSSCSP